MLSVLDVFCGAGASRKASAKPAFASPLARMLIPMPAPPTHTISRTL